MVLLDRVWNTLHALEHQQKAFALAHGIFSVVYQTSVVEILCVHHVVEHVKQADVLEHSSLDYVLELPIEDVVLLDQAPPALVERYPSLLLRVHFQVQVSPLHHQAVAVLVVEAIVLLWNASALTLLMV